ncbi:GNAT family N-acetyltransferase, partial [Myxococcota bacterium]|nr:GNAT family N-acetyltransferase [Myxococcota bacterium]
MRVDLVERPGEEWDRFAEAHPDGRLGHAAAWAGILETAYGLEPHYLVARSSEGELTGILPVVAFRSRPGGRPRLISLPFLDSAGILATDGAAKAALRDRALTLVAERGCAGLELRDFAIASGPPESDLAMDRVNLVLPLKTTEESQWTALSAKVRNQCRKADREGLTLRTGESGSLREDFLLPYRVNMRDLGSPPHSAAFFEVLTQRFGDRLRFVVTEHAGRPVGGLVAIRFGRRVYVPWASTLRTERNRCPN